MRTSGNLTLKVSGIWLQIFNRSGETDSWRAQRKPCTHRTQEKGAVNPQETEPDLSRSVQESQAETWVDSGLPWGPGTLNTTVLQEATYWHNSFWRTYPNNSFSASGQTTGREHCPTHQKNIGLKIYQAWPHPPEQNTDSPKPVPPIRKFPKSSYPYPSEDRQNENQNHSKLTKMIIRFTALSNSIKL